MKTLLAGVKRIAGTAKASGNPFDMANVLCLTPITPSSGKTTVNGAGYELMEIPLDPAHLVAFMKLPYPSEVVLKLEHRPRFGKVEMIVVGVESVAKAA